MIWNPISQIFLIPTFWLGLQEFSFQKRINVSQDSVGFDGIFFLEFHVQKLSFVSDLRPFLPTLHVDHQSVLRHYTGSSNTVHSDTALKVSSSFFLFSKCMPSGNIYYYLLLYFCGYTECREREDCCWSQPMATVFEVR